MKFKQEQNEIFWLNIVKHDLTRYEFKVLAAFVTDAPQFRTSISIIKDRTGIKNPHISRALSGLCYQNILIKNEDNTLEVAPEILTKEYTPKTCSSLILRKTKEQNYVSGNGDFKKQSEVERVNIEVVDNNVKAIIRKGKQPTNPYNSWHTFNSSYCKSKIWCKVEPFNEKFKVIYSLEHPKNSYTRIAPLEVTEEFCYEVLKITDPIEILKYIYDPYIDEFCKKHNIKINTRE